MRRLLLVLLLGWGVVTQVAAEAAPTILFDDFSYTSQAEMSANGWIVREGAGWPGVPDAIWRAENVTFVADPDNEANQLVRMTSSVEVGKTYQTQFCHQRKYYEGTYAARVQFSDEPVSGSDGDNIVQTFYLISPQEFNLDPNYSELDFEYLPNGGWGFEGNVLFATTWETFQLDPWIAQNASEAQPLNMAGWHTLVIQISDGEARYFVDGEPFATHSEEYYPEVPMSINFNLWFVNGGQVRVAEDRAYEEHIDWVFFAANTVLMPDEIEAQVAAFRAAETPFTDTVPPWEEPLESPCNF